MRVQSAISAERAESVVSARVVGVGIVVSAVGAITIVRATREMAIRLVRQVRHVQDAIETIVALVVR